MNRIKLKFGVDVSTKPEEWWTDLYKSMHYAIFTKRMSYEEAIDYAY